MRIEAKLEELRLMLPEPMRVPPDLRMPFSWVRVCGDRAYISGHIALNADGSVAGQLGKVGAEVSAEEGYESARLVALAHLASLKRALGDLDRISLQGRAEWVYPCGVGLRLASAPNRLGARSQILR